MINSSPLKTNLKKMKNRYTGICMLITVLVMASSCKKFDEINTNPLAASADQVQVDYFINNSIISTKKIPVTKIKLIPNIIFIIPNKIE